MKLCQIKLFTILFGDTDMIFSSNGDGPEKLSSNRAEFLYKKAGDPRSRTDHGTYQDRLEASLSAVATKKGYELRLLLADMRDYAHGLQNKTLGLSTILLNKGASRKEVIANLLSFNHDLERAHNLEHGRICHGKNFDPAAVQDFAKKWGIPVDMSANAAKRMVGLRESADGNISAFTQLRGMIDRKLRQPFSHRHG
jgi:hypothetical protein